jgi:RHS repeat-associated protein
VNWPGCNARIGHTERLKALFKELEGRTLTGAATEYVRGAREGLWSMEHEPGISFLCGPMALKNVFQTARPQGVDIAPIEQARSGTQGFSLQEVQDLAKAAKLPYRMAKRKPGAPLPLPAVAHWKVSHYAALVGEQNGLYHLKDPTFGDDLWISKAALEHEASGYYLIATADKLPDGWEAVSAEEAKTIRGMGNTGGGCQTCTTPLSPSTGGGCGGGGGGGNPFYPWLDQLLPWLGPLLSGGGGGLVGGFNSFPVGAAGNSITWSLPGAVPAGGGSGFSSVPIGAAGNTMTWGVSAAYSSGNSSLVFMASPASHGMANYDFLSMSASLRVRDAPIQYSPPIGPAISFAVTYIQREADQPANLNFSNLGPKWTHNWLAYVEDTPSNAAADVTLHRAGGGSDVFTGYDASTRQFTVNARFNDVLKRSQDSPPVYQRLLPDGSREIYAKSGPLLGTTRQVFLTQVIDPQGNAVKLGYDAKRRLASLTDAVGKVTTLAYADSTDVYKITRVTDPAGRFATFTYQYTNYAGIPCDSQKQTGCKADKLASITDPVGIVSSFRYNYGSDFMNALTTPYGTTTFDFGESYNDTTGPRRWLNATDPLGHRERLDYLHNAYGIAGFEAAVPQGMNTVNNFLSFRNSFYWDKNATAQACRFGAVTQCDYTQAELMHWLHGQGTGSNKTQDVMESRKKPLESRIWYNYPGQDPNVSNFPIFVGTIDKPSVAGRLLDDGSTQLRQSAYNALGLVTQETDPKGRTRFYEYAANQVDVLRVWQKVQASCDVPNGVKVGCDLIGQYAYNAQHRAVSYTDTAGKTTTYAYNAWGQLTKVTNPLGQVMQLGYIENSADANYRRLQQITQVGKVVAKFAYDSAGRISQATDAGGYVRSYSYDNLDRVTKVSYPDGSADASAYNKMDLASETNRLGRKTQYAYNALRQLAQVTYPKNPGDPDRLLKLNWCACGALNSLTDPNGQTTRWTHDVQGRNTGKFYPGNASASPDESYVYEATTSRLHQVFKQRNPGPALETDYSYDIDDQMHSVTYDAGAVKLQPSPVTFLYDSSYPRLIGLTDGLGTTQYSYYLPGALGAGQVKDEDGPWVNDTLHYTYDALGRQASRSISGKGTAQQSYDSLARLASETNPLGKFSYGYLGSTAQVSTINTVLPSKQPGLSNAYTYFDNAHDRRLQRLQHKAGNPQTLLASYDYSYDAEGRITSWSQQQSGQPLLKATYQYDGIGQLLQASPVGAVGKTYAFDYDQAGNRVAVTVDGNAATETANKLNQLVQRSVGAAYQYDSGGNRISDSANHRQYVWDGANRLASIVDTNTPGNHSDFSYDGLGRLRIIQEYQNAALKSEKRYVWCGLQRCEERSASNAVTKRYYGQGEVRGSKALYYSRDHLGSVREVTDASGAVQAQYRYDHPWGQPTKLAGTLDSDFRYSDHYYHAASSLHLAPFRAYETATGRWLNRDPAGETGGANLYGYVLNDPVNLLDPSGKGAVGALNLGGMGFAIGAFWGPGGTAAGAALGALIGAFQDDDKFHPSSCSSQ